jgi:hypothetical protein
MEHRRDDDAGVEIDRMLGPVRQVRATVLQLGDLGIRIGLAGPLVVRQLLALAGAVDANKIVRTRRLDASRRTIARTAALASIVEASMPIRLPLIKPFSATSRNTQSNTVSWTSCGSRPRVFDNHE